MKPESTQTVNLHKGSHTHSDACLKQSNFNTNAWHNVEVDLGYVPRWFACPQAVT